MFQRPQPTIRHPTSPACQCGGGTAGVPSQSHYCDSWAPEEPFFSDFSEFRDFRRANDPDGYRIPYCETVTDSDFKGSYTSLFWGSDASRPPSSHGSLHASDFSLDTELTEEDNDLLRRLENLKAPTTIPAWDDKVAPFAKDQSKEFYAGRKEYFRKLGAEGKPIHNARELLAPVKEIKLPFVISDPDKAQMLHNLFPRVYFHYGDAYCGHDHPISHGATMVGMRQIVQVIQPGENGLDVNGNPRAAAAFNATQKGRTNPKHLDVQVEVHSARDFHRRGSKWHGAPYFEGALSEMDLSVYNVFVSSHVIYYQSHEYVHDFLSKGAKGCHYLALVHEHPGNAGKIYGELTYTKKNGITTQVSPSGEFYTHPDVDRWTQVFSWSTPTRALSWTKHCICDGLSILDVYLAEPDVVKGDDGLLPKVLETAPVVQSFGPFYIKMADQYRELQISNPKFLEALRFNMAGKRRDPASLRDLFITARLYTTKEGVDGRPKFDVDIDHFLDHIALAYTYDVDKEIALVGGLALDGSKLYQHTKAMQGGVFSADNLSAWFNGAKLVAKTGLKIYNAASPLSALEKAL